MDYLKGGDLRFHLTRHIRFSEEQTRFFICNIITALEYIHSKNIIHRDIKPENLVLEEEGYVRITDFGIAKKSKDNNKGDTSGTPGYMAPEVMRGAVHSFEVDFFAIGIIGYEFMKGKRPYAGKSRKEIREEMLMKQIFIKNEDIEEGWTKESVDFFNKLLIRKKENRLGFKGINELKEHPWIKYYPWNMINDKSLPSPFVPQNKDNFDLRYCARSEKIGEETKMRYEEILMDKNYQNIFKNFFFNFDYEKKLLLKKKEKEDTINDNKNIINNIYYKVQKCNNNNLNSKNSFFNKKSSYKQLPFSQNKIILDNLKDKYNTINEVNDKKKNNNDNMDDSLYSAIFKKERLKLINSII
jgi:serine/threonine protein kinase